MKYIMVLAFVLSASLYAKTVTVGSCGMSGVMCGSGESVADAVGNLNDVLNPCLNSANTECEMRVSEPSIVQSHSCCPDKAKNGGSCGGEVSACVTVTRSCK